PSIADQVRVGYFSQDRSSQTEVSEIAQLKEMTEVLQNLVRDIENLKRVYIMQSMFYRQTTRTSCRRELWTYIVELMIESWSWRNTMRSRVNVTHEEDYRQQLAACLSPADCPSQHSRTAADKQLDDAFQTGHSQASSVDLRIQRCTRLREE
ncbi:hypothetical protein OS493_040260, partial [Desmophyllum pertusum]